jgi:hypothetical protein
LVAPQMIRRGWRFSSAPRIRFLNLPIPNVEGIRPIEPEVAHQKRPKMHEMQIHATQEYEAIILDGETSTLWLIGGHYSLLYIIHSNLWLYRQTYPWTFNFAMPFSQFDSCLWHLCIIREDRHSAALEIWLSSFL